MFDSDVAMLFHYETKYLNRQVLRNHMRFPSNYCFQLTEYEFKTLRCQNGTLELKQGQYRKYLPYVFTEYGITMLAGILKSGVAVRMSLKIVDTFVRMKKYISNELIEQRYFNNLTIQNTEDIKLLNESFLKLSNKEVLNEIYFEGQIYDAYSKIIDIMYKAKQEIIIIDNYGDKTVLDMISRMKVQVLLITKSNGLLKKLDIEKYNKEYSNLKIIYDNTFHDRYIILDRNTLYHLGSSLNHIGNKTFSINKIEESSIIKLLLDKIDNIIKL